MVRSLTTVVSMPPSAPPDMRDRFVAHFQAHQRLVVKVAGAYAWNAADRDDLVQEIAVQLWRAYPRYDDTRSFSTWLYRIALNVAISWARSEGPRRRSGVAYEAALHEPASDDDHSSVEVDDDEAQRILRAFVASCDALPRAVLLLYLDARSYAEIAEILGISETAVSTRINRLKEQLRRFAANPARATTSAAEPATNTKEDRHGTR